MSGHVYLAQWFSFPGTVQGPTVMPTVRGRKFNPPELQIIQVTLG
jgi:hypothetical protein